MLPGKGTRLSKKEEKPCLLGNGGFSFVYEAFFEADKDEHLALKAAVLEDNSKGLSDFVNSIDIQKNLQESCDNVVRILTDGIFRIMIDGDGNIVETLVYDAGNSYGNTANANTDNAITSNAIASYVDAASANSFVLAIVLMEKLESVIVNDKFSGARLTRKELETEDGIISFAKDISFALLKADELNILHRDIKLENIFYDSAKSIYKLGDFGNAKISKETGTIVGTKGYEAPEINNMLSDTYGEEADIYSFGVTIFLLMNGLRFPDSENYSYSKVQYNEGYVFPQCSRFSNALNDLVRQMCACFPKYRFSDIYQIHDIFSHFEQYAYQKGLLQRGQAVPPVQNADGDTLQPANVMSDNTQKPVQLASDNTMKPAPNSSDETIMPVKGSDDTVPPENLVQESGSAKNREPDKQYPSTIDEAVDVMCDPDASRAERVLARDIIKKDNAIQRFFDFIAVVLLSFLSFEGFIPHENPLPFWNIFIISMLLISAAVFIHKKLKVTSLAIEGAGTGLLLFDLQMVVGHLAFLHKIYDYHIGIVFAALFVFVIASYFGRVRYFRKLELKNW